MAPVPDAVKAMRGQVAVRHLPMLLRFRRRLGYWPDAAWPRTHNERMLWRKIFDHNPEFPALTDKLAVKAVIAERCPELPQARVAWAGTAPAELPDAVLAGGFLLKANNGSGDNLLPVGLPRDEVEQRLRRWVLPRRRREEWAYWSIVPQVLAEERLELGGGGLPTDIKVHVCGGQIGHLWATDKIGGASLVLDPAGQAVAATGIDNELPLAWSERLGELAREAARLAPVLAGGLDYVRVDFMVTAAGLVAGELTLYPAAGFDTWSDPAVAQRLETLWDIRQSWFLRVSTTAYAQALREAWKP
jgi:hypothetical protein